MEQNTREFSLEQASQIIQGELAKVAGTQFTPAAFLENIENVSGLIIEREPGHYEFSHKSFQEYLAAVQIKDSHQDSILIQNIHHDWWAETLRLYATQSNATPLIHAALDQPTMVSLKLALDCAEEGLRVDPEVREELKQRLEAGLTSPDPAIAQLAAEVKLARRLGNFLRIDQTLEIDTSYVTYAEYHLFINALEKAGEPYQPNQESTHQFPPKEAQTPIQGLTITQKNRFCAWLNWHNSETLANGTISHYRLPTPTEFNHYPIPDDALRESGIRLVRYQLPLPYRQLAYLLACGQWQAANTETAQIMRQIARQENLGWLNDNDIKKFPLTDLNLIDQLWYHYRYI
jgi:predicted NACHT family NTPase